MISYKFKKLLLSLLLHPLSLAVPVAVFVIWLVPDLFQKYTLSLDYEYIHGPGITIEHYDLDHDKTSEWLAAANTAQNKSGISIHNKLGIIFHWHFDGYFIPDQPKCMVGDADNDGHDEVYTFTMKSDSLLMNCIDYRLFPDLALKNIFIARIPGEKPELNLKFFPGKITDLDGDSFKEIVFVVNTGYGGSPRKVFAYNRKNNQLSSTIELGASLGSPCFSDIDNDNLDEIVISNYSPGNINDLTQKMRDSTSYLIVLDNTLDFLFPPVVNPGLYNGVASVPLNTRSGIFIASIFGVSNQQPDSPTIRFFNTNGTLSDKKQLTLDRRNRAYALQPLFNSEGADHLLYISTPGNLTLYDDNLNIIKKSEINIGFGQLIQSDIDNDGKRELIFPTPQIGKWAILRNNLTHPVYFATDSNHKTPQLFINLQGDKKPQFSFQLGDRQSVFTYGFNPMYYWQYPVYVGIYVSIFLFILLINKLQRIQQRRKTETKQKIAELELLSIRNQLDPHFTFNALTTIGSVMMQGRNNEAYSLLLNFSKMLRSIIGTSDEVSRSLKEELEFTRNYLEIQQFRFKNRIEFDIKVDQSIDLNRNIPKSCIQTYAENSIKHGISPKDEGGKVSISVSQQDNLLNISVTDNGIGRERASKNPTTSTGRGNSIMRQYYLLLNKSNNNPIIEKILDLYDNDGKPAGTKVLLSIPDNYSFPLRNSEKQEV